MCQSKGIEPTLKVLIKDTCKKLSFKSAHYFAKRKRKGGGIQPCINPPTCNTTPELSVPIQSTNL